MTHMAMQREREDSTRNLSSESLKEERRTGLGKEDWLGKSTVSVTRPEAVNPALTSSYTCVPAAAS